MCLSGPPSPLKRFLPVCPSVRPSGTTKITLFSEQILRPKRKFWENFGQALQILKKKTSILARTSHDFSLHTCVQAIDTRDRTSLPIAKNQLKTSQEFSEQFVPSTYKTKSFLLRIHTKKVHPRFAKNLGRQILGIPFLAPRSGWRKGGLSLRGLAFMAVLTGLAVLESTLPSFCWSYKRLDKKATVTVLAVMAVSVMTATPVKLTPPPKGRHPDKIPHVLSATRMSEVCNCEVAMEARNCCDTLNRGCSQRVLGDKFFLQWRMWSSFQPQITSLSVLGTINGKFPPIPERAPKSVQNRTLCAKSVQKRRSFWNRRKPHLLRRLIIWRFQLCGPYWKS